MLTITCWVEIKDTKGKIMETFMTKINICLFNDDSPTYLHPATSSHHLLPYAFHGYYMEGEGRSSWQ